MIYLGRNHELAARVRGLLDELRQHTCRERRCAELWRQVRRSLTRAAQYLVFDEPVLLNLGDEAYLIEP